ncbi:MAG TPA: hypothetical protein VIN58_19060, partial [Roseateles sp.]
MAKHEREAEALAKETVLTVLAGLYLIFGGPLVAFVLLRQAYIHSSAVGVVLWLVFAGMAMAAGQYWLRKLKARRFAEACRSEAARRAE